METALYSQSLHKLTAFSLIQEGDGYATCAWKVPTGRILSAAVTLTALAESLIATLATVLFSPLYYIRRDSFNTIAGKAAEAAKIVGLSTKRFFGFEKIEKPAIFQPPAKPATPWEKALQFLKDRVSVVTHFAHERPKTTFSAITFGAAVVGAYYFGLFEHLPSLFSRPPSAPDLPMPSLTIIQERTGTCPAATLKLIADKPFWPSPPSMPPFQSLSLPRPSFSVVQESPGTCPAFVQKQIADQPFWKSPPSMPPFQAPALPRPSLPVVQESTGTFPAFFQNSSSAVPEKLLSPDAEEVTRLLELISSGDENSQNTNFCCPIVGIIRNVNMSKISSGVSKLCGKIFERSESTFHRAQYYAPKLKKVTSPLARIALGICLPGFVHDRDLFWGGRLLPR